jgi:hypothetical protein
MAESAAVNWLTLTYRLQIRAQRIMCWLTGGHKWQAGFGKIEICNKCYQGRDKA